MFSESLKQSKIFIIGCILAVLFVLYQVILAITRIGEIPVSITAIPSESKIFANEKLIATGSKKVYLKAGEYTFRASASGFKDDKLDLSIAKGKPNVVELVPAPNSLDAEYFLKDNPKIQAEREAIGGRRAVLEGAQVQAATPILEDLPVTDVLGPFSIDYGASEDKKYGSFLLVNDSSPKGRVKALEWIRHHGQDPTDFDIRFADFYNPLTDSEQAR